MIDLHFHCLPGVDDGPDDWDEAVALCRAAADQGTETIVATPHVLRERWLNDDVGARDELVVKLNARLGGHPAVLPGCEFFFSSDVVDLIERGADSPLTTLNRSRYLLVEFPASWVPPNAESIFFELSLLGIQPVIAHPERNMDLARSPARLEALAARGGLIQITAGSLLGAFGRPALAASLEFYRLGLVDVVASDAHSLERRPPLLGEARKMVMEHWGEEAARGLFETNPRAIIDSEPLPWSLR